jgi:hypothetical protein
MSQVLEASWRVRSAIHQKRKDQSFMPWWKRSCKNKAFQRKCGRLRQSLVKAR